MDAYTGIRVHFCDLSLPSQSIVLVNRSANSMCNGLEASFRLRASLQRLSSKSALDQFPEYIVAEFYLPQKKACVV